MRLVLIGVMVAAFGGAVSAQDVYVQGHTTANGTYVAPHYRTAPDGNRLNNYSSQPNVNPYTGRAGTVDPYAQPAPVYQPYQPYQPRRY